MGELIEKRVALLNQHIQEWFRLNNRVEAKPKELMTYLIEKEVYKNDNRQGNPLRKDLRKLRDKNLLHLIKGVKLDQKAKISIWFLTKVD